MEGSEATRRESGNIDVAQGRIAVGLANVVCNRDDRPPRAGARAIRASLDGAQLFPEGGAIRPQAARQCFAHGRHRIRTGRIPVVEVPAAFQLDSERLEVARPHAHETGWQSRTGAARSFRDLSRELDERRPTGEHHRSVQRGAEPVGELLVEPCERRGVRVITRAQHDACADEAIGLEPQIRPKHVDDGAHHQT